MLPGKAIFLGMIIKLWWLSLELDNQWHFIKVWMLGLNIKPGLPGDLAPFRILDLKLSAYCAASSAASFLEHNSVGDI